MIGFLLGVLLVTAVCWWIGKAYWHMAKNVFHPPTRRAFDAKWGARGRAMRRKLWDE